MTPLDQLLGSLLERFAPTRGSAEGGVALVVDALVLDLPVESRIGGASGIAVSLPRGRLKTGFDAPHGRLRARLVRTDAKESR